MSKLFYSLSYYLNSSLIRSIQL